jgi:hypothetical protein
MTPAPLPPWPKNPASADYTNAEYAWAMRCYEYARAEAAMARLVVAVAKLKEAREDVGNWAGYASDYFVQKHDLAGCLLGYEDTLALIGDLPPSSQERG